MANSRPKILIAASIYPPDPGGPATHAKAQFERFPEFGFETSLAALAHYRKYPRGIRHALYLAALLVKGTGSSIVYAHDALGVGLPALIAARILGKKLIVRIGGDVAWERQAEKINFSMNEWYAKGMHKGEKTYKFSRWVISRADAIVVTSGLLRDLYVRYYDVPAEKISVIYNPFIKAHSESAAQGQTIVFASRLIAYKNLALVLRVLAEVALKYPDLKLILMADGPERKNLERQAKKLGIDKNVIFAGSVPHKEVLEQISSCLFGIAPALTEFNPNYIMECISFGKPFIISREHGLPYKVPEEFTFDPRSESELFDRISNLLSNEGYARAQEFVKSIQFSMSWQENLKSNIGVINSLLGKGVNQ